MIEVMVTGAYGRMGREAARTVWDADDMLLAGAVDGRGEGTDIGQLIECGSTGINIENDLEEFLKSKRPDVAVDFTGPQAVYHNALKYLEYGVRPVIGSTGLDAGQIKEIIDLSEKRGIGGLVAPNFAIGAVLMMRFAAEAARFLPDVEIIEMHHDQKIDAPSGTAIKTAEIILEQRGDEYKQGLASEIETLPGSRGGNFSGGIRIHSVRLPGLVAHQEVILGGLGQTLTIRHDSITRESFMPGVLLAVRRSLNLNKVVYGLDKLLFETV
ncbi:4-hydroxy-tetrahydrodipicolinate reductase [Pelotomaculum propionicicum]|uniref:4-hydroxy-tetrahydrodipicolinate reductase n=1 Tax=Pelotomaculum propionicicum TaxID=258475 RepID=UPI003B7FD216